MAIRIEMKIIDEENEEAAYGAVLCLKKETTKDTEAWVSALAEDIFRHRLANLSEAVIRICLKHGWLNHSK